MSIGPVTTDGAIARVQRINHVHEIIWVAIFTGSSIAGLSRSLEIPKSLCRGRNLMRGTVGRHRRPEGISARRDSLDPLIQPRRELPLWDTNRDTNEEQNTPEQ